jgi:Xaa-Pro aminopeptidase
MFQSFDAKTTPDQGPPRVADLRAEMRDEGVDVFLVPRADRFQGEYVAPSDERLAWLTGFTGSAGFAAILDDRAGLFVDGRYRVQVRAQSDMDTFTPVDWPETKLEDWLIEQLPRGGTVGYDPWLHTGAEVARLTKALGPRQITLRPLDNLVDRIWTDRPAPPMAPAPHGPRPCGPRARGEAEGRGGRSGRCRRGCGPPHPARQHLLAPEPARRGCGAYAASACHGGGAPDRGAGPLRGGGETRRRHPPPRRDGA